MILLEVLINLCYDIHDFLQGHWTGGPSFGTVRCKNSQEKTFSEANWGSHFWVSKVQEKSKKMFSGAL